MSRRRPDQPDRPPRRLLVEACADCGETLATSNGCPAEPYPTAPPWGRESYWRDEDDLEPKPRCPDCWATIGRAHHRDCIRAWCELCDVVLFACPHGDGDDGDGC